MKNLRMMHIDRYRDSSPRVHAMYGSDGDETCGVFIVPSPIDQVALRVLASSGGGWDHVSVSRHNRCPNWLEMCHIKDLFFDAEDCVVQYHPPESMYVNNHPYCLHLWRWIDGQFPMPQEQMVGVKGMDPSAVRAALKR